MSCDICNDEGTVKFPNDELNDIRTWPCPKCRVRRYIVEQPWTDHDILDWRDDSISFETMQRLRLNDRIARDLVNAVVDVKHEITGNFHMLTAEMRVVIPNEKEENEFCHWHEQKNIQPKDVPYWNTECGITVSMETTHNMQRYLMNNFCGHCGKRTKKAYDIGSS